MKEERKPFWAKCGDCSHIWPVAYLPMTMTQMSTVMKRIVCPMCAAGSKRILIAKQNNGVLNEPDPLSGGK